MVPESRAGGGSPQRRQAKTAQFALEPQRRAQVLLWVPPSAVRCAASAVLGGGIGERDWLVNAEVPIDYARTDPAVHLAEIAAQVGVTGGRGVGFLTAASVADVVVAEDGGAGCAATVGLLMPTWAAAPDGSWSDWTPGTINLVCWIPAALSDSALIGAVITATEAKVQALLEAGVPGTGTASDAVAVCCPPGGDAPFAGPRSTWGARLARAVHAAVAGGTAGYLGGSATGRGGARSP